MLALWNAGLLQSSSGARPCLQRSPAKTVVERFDLGRHVAAVLRSGGEADDDANSTLTHVLSEHSRADDLMSRRLCHHRSLRPGPMMFKQTITTELLAVLTQMKVEASFLHPRSRCVTRTSVCARICHVLKIRFPRPRGRPTVPPSSCGDRMAFDGNGPVGIASSLLDYSCRLLSAGRIPRFMLCALPRQGRAQCDAADS